MLEVVLGIDTPISIAILTNRLPPGRQTTARRIGIGLASTLRLGLIGAIAVIVRLTEPVFPLSCRWPPTRSRPSSPGTRPG